MAVSRSVYERATRELAHKSRDNIRRERDETVREITRVWREGFANLKADNDRRQVELARWYKMKMDEVDAWLRAQLAAGPPQ